MNSLANRPNKAVEAQNRVRAQAAANGGMIRTHQALALGVQSRDFYALVKAGELRQIDRGLYQLSDMSTTAVPDILQATLKVPQGVICLISALALHGLTTQIPRIVQLAIPKKSKAPRLGWPYLEVYYTSGEAYTEGIEELAVDGRPVRVYCMEKTIADCFKHRAKVGLDVCLEALHNYRRQGGKKLADLYHYAEIDRVKKTMQPYLEAIWSQA